MSDQPRPRVRVTGPPRRRADVVRPAGTREIDAETALGDIRVGPMPLAWLLLGMLTYPWLVLLGWLYIRRVESNERDFADLVGSVLPDDEAR